MYHFRKVEEKWGTLEWNNCLIQFCAFFLTKRQRHLPPTSTLPFSYYHSGLKFYPFLQVSCKFHFWESFSTHSSPGWSLFGLQRHFLLCFLIWLQFLQQIQAPLRFPALCCVLGTLQWTWPIPAIQEEEVIKIWDESTVKVSSEGTENQELSIAEAMRDTPRETT